MEGLKRSSRGRRRGRRPAGRREKPRYDWVLRLSGLEQRRGVAHAYVVSRIAGTSVARIDKSAWGLFLRVLAVIADGLAVYFAGRAFGFWGY